ncbi:MAG: hypothetical protein ABJO29_08705 [Yoonia sp.]|uniref:hypothetical protein n=1 Tax=Yoonia sp. TaxID=2212373 RepID=UPI003266DB9D
MTAPTLFKSADAKISVYLDGPLWSGERTAAVGQFSCKKKESGAEVLTTALDFVRSKNIRRVIGPMDGDTWHSYRFVTETDDSPTFMLEPSNPQTNVDVFVDAGFQSVSDYFSARVALKDTATTAPPRSEDLYIEQWDGEDPEELFQQVYGLSIAAFEKNAFYKPVSLDVFLQMYMPVLPVLKKELIFFARTSAGRLAGFLFAIPNYNEGPAPKTVILKTYASLHKGAGQMLAHAFHETARELGYETAVHALIHNDNLSAVRSAAEGAEIFRRYTLFGLKLDG